MAREEMEELQKKRHRPNERQEQILREHRGSLRQRQREMVEFRQREREMEAYGEKYGKRAMRKRYPVARERYEDQKRREAQEREIVKRAGVKSEGKCVVM